MDANENSQNRRAERYELDADIEFIVDADILKASAVNVSQSGILFATDTPIYVSMRVLVNGHQEERRARLAWVGREGDSEKLKIGLEFADEATPEEKSDLL